VRVLCLANGRDKARHSKCDSRKDSIVAFPGIHSFRSLVNLGVSVCLEHEFENLLKKKKTLSVTVPFLIREVLQGKRVAKQIEIKLSVF
jgi:hypothetical protein